MVRITIGDRVKEIVILQVLSSLAWETWVTLVHYKLKCSFKKTDQICPFYLIS